VLFFIERLKIKYTNLMCL